jgi:hypothetical protein
LPAKALEQVTEIRKLLKIPETVQKFNLVYSPMLGATNELTVGSRSMLQIMGAFASYADVPEQDLQEQRALPSAPNSDATGGRDPVEIKCSPGKPAEGEAFAAVHYRNHWFWIADRDWRSKRALTAIMFLFTMSDSGGDQPLPLITIPAQ